MARFYQPDLSENIDSPFVRDGNDKLVRRTYWLDMNDRTLVMVMTNGIGANLTNDEKRAHLADLRREHLVDQVCIQEILRLKSSAAYQRAIALDQRAIVACRAAPLMSTLLRRIPLSPDIPNTLETALFQGGNPQAPQSPGGFALVNLRSHRPTRSAAANRSVITQKIVVNSVCASRHRTCEGTA